MSSCPYHRGARNLQDRFDTRRLADRVDEKFLSRPIIDADDRAFIERMDIRTVAFPNYDGNGMYVSTGNVLENPNVGMLFIDFVSARPSRMRLCQAFCR